MKTISLTQPWASLVVCGAKRYETRAWQTCYRGWVAIHASKAMPKEARRLAFDEPFYSALHAVGLVDRLPEMPNVMGFERLPLGAVVGLALLVECFPTRLLAAKVSAGERAFGDWTEGRWYWRLDRPMMLKEPIPARGALGLWDWEPPAEIAEWLREQGVRQG